MRVTLQSISLLSCLFLSPMVFADIDRGWRNFEQGDLQAAMAEFEASAKMDDASSAFIYGMLLLDADMPTVNTSTVNTTEGRAWLKKAADLGNAKAAYNLAYYYAFEWADMPEAASAFTTYIEMAQAGGIAEAYLLRLNERENYQAVIGTLTLEEVVDAIEQAYALEVTPLTEYYKGFFYLYAERLPTNVERNLARAVTLLESAYEGGITQAAFPLKALYQEAVETDLILTDRDSAAGLAFFEAYIEDNRYDLLVTDHRYSQPIAYLGETARQNLRAQLDILKKRAETEAPIAQFLALLAQKGLMTSAEKEGNQASDRDDENAALAVSYLRQAFALGALDAGISLYRSTKESENEAEGKKYLMAAADAGNFEAILILSNFYGDDATYYLQKAAKLGDLESMLKLAEEYNVGYIDGKSNERMATEWYQSVMKAYPDDPRAYARMGLMLMNQVRALRERDQVEIQAYLQKAVDLDPDNSSVLLMLAHFYNDQYTQFDMPERSLALYDRIIDLDVEGTDTTHAMLFKGQLLKAGRGKVQPNYPEANALFEAILEKYGQDGISLYELGDSYEHGKGVSKDIEKAITYYQQSEYFEANLPLGKLLIAKNDPALREVGIGYLLLAASYDGHRDEVIRLMLPFKDDSLKVQSWLLEQALRSSYTNQFDAKQLIFDGCDAGIMNFCVRKAQYQLDTDFSPKEGLTNLIAYGESGSEGAIHALIDYYQHTNNDQEEERWLLALVNLTQTDRDRDYVASLYFHKGRYVDAVKWYSAMEKPSDSSEQYFVRAKHLAEEFTDLQTRAENHWEAAADLLYYYQVNDMIREAIDLMQKWQAKGNERVNDLLLPLLDKSGEAADQKTATEMILKMAREGDVDAYQTLYHRYIYQKDPAITRDQLKAWMAEYRRSGEYYSDTPLTQIDAFDQAEKALLKAQTAFEKEGSQKHRTALISALNKVLADYRMNEGIAQSPEESWALLLELAALGDAEALYEVGMRYRYGDNEYEDRVDRDRAILAQQEAPRIVHDWEKAAAYFTKALDAGLTSEVESDEAATHLEFYQEVVVPASRRDIDAIYRLGRNYFDEYEFNRQPSEKARGFSLIETAANNGHIEAMTYLGDFYAEAYQNYPAKIWLGKAADQGHDYASYKLADIAMNAFSETPSDEEKALVIGYLKNTLKTMPRGQALLMKFYLRQNMQKEAEALLASLSEAIRIDLYPMMGYYYEVGMGQLLPDYNKVVSIYQALDNAGKREYGIKLATFYLWGGHGLAPNEALGLAQLEKHYKVVLASDDEGLTEQYVDTLYRHREAHQAFVMPKLEVLSHKGNRYASSVLSEIYKEERNMQKAYLYALSVSDWHAEKFAEYLTEEEQREAREMAKKLHLLQ